MMSPEEIANALTSMRGDQLHDLINVYGVDPALAELVLSPNPDYTASTPPFAPQSLLKLVDVLRGPLCLRCLVALQSGAEGYDEDAFSGRASSYVGDIHAMVVRQGESMCYSHFNTERGYTPGGPDYAKEDADAEAAAAE